MSYWRHKVTLSSYAQIGVFLWRQIDPSLGKAFWIIQKNSKQRISEYANMNNQHCQGDSLYWLYCMLSFLGSLMKSSWLSTLDYRIPTLVTSHLQLRLVTLNKSSLSRLTSLPFSEGKLTSNTSSCLTWSRWSTNHDSSTGRNTGRCHSIQTHNICNDLRLPTTRQVLSQRGGSL